LTFLSIGGSHVGDVISFPEQVLEEGVAFVHRHKLTLMDLLRMSSSMVWILDALLLTNRLRRSFFVKDERTTVVG
jgi:hypothetical protein